MSDNGDSGVANKGLDLRGMLRDGVSDEKLLELIAAGWSARADRYSELRASLKDSRGELKRIEMYYIGG